MAGIQGLRGTGTFDVDFRPKNYRELFTLLEPNGNAPLNALLSMTSSEATDDPEYKNFRDELPERKLTVDGAVASSSTATITTDAGNDNLFAVAGTILVNSETGEVMRVTADSTATGLTVERNIGGTSHTIADGAALFISGSAFEEGASSPTGVSFDATVATNYTQIFRTAFKVTETLRATNLRSLLAARQSKVTDLTIEISAEHADEAFADFLEETLASAGGGNCPVSLIYRQSDNSARIRLGERWRVIPSDELLQELRNVVGSKGVVLQYH